MKSKRNVELFAEKFPRLVAEMNECLKTGEQLAKVIRDQLGRI